MAFNPFHSFRKHKKVMFAALTIVCMITFILAFGRGDPFERIAALFGGGGRKGTKAETVTTLYDKKVTVEDLAELKQQRQLANDLMTWAVLDGHSTALTDMTKALSRMPAMLSSQLKMIIETTQEANFIVRGIRVPQGGGQDEQRRAAERIALNDHPRTQLRYREKALQGFAPPFGQPMPPFLATLKDAVHKYPNEAELLNKLMLIVSHYLWRAGGISDSPPPLAADLSYFGGGARADDLLDFLVWKHQADHFEINLTDADVRAEINRQTLSKDTLQGDSAKDAQRLGRLLKEAGYPDNTGISVEQVYNFFRDELRVNMAQQAVLGAQPGAMGEFDRLMGVNVVPTAITPDQFWNYFREKRTTLQKVAFLPIPVKNFESQITATPSAAQLQILFNAYREQEPNPERETPGFRQPKRINLDWVVARVDSEHYRKVGRERSAAVAASLIGDPWLGVLYVHRLQETYSAEKRGMRSDTYRLPAWTNESFALSFHTYASMQKAEAVASLFGQLNSPLTPLVGVSGWAPRAVLREEKDQATAVAEEARERAKSPLVGAAFMTGGTYPSPLVVAAALNGVYDKEKGNERHLSLSHVTPQLMERMETGLAEQTLRDNLTKFIKQVESWKSKPQERADELAKAVKDYGLTSYTVARLLDQYEVDEIEPLKALREAVKNREEMMARMMRQTPPKFRFASILFDNQFGTYKADAAVDTSGNQFIFWKTEESRAETFPSYDKAPAEIQEAVKKAWRLMKAREKARQAVEEVMTEARKHKNAEDAVRVLRDVSKKNGWGTVFDLDGIARLAEDPTIRPLMGKRYRPYAPPEDKINARPSFADDLLKALKEPGNVTYVTNKPETIYYVAVLERIEDEATVEKKFRELYKKSAFEDTLLMRMEEEVREKYLKGQMEQFRAEAGKVNEQGEWEIDADVRKRIEGKGSDAEN